MKKQSTQSDSLIKLLWNLMVLKAFWFVEFRQEMIAQAKQAIKEERDDIIEEMMKNGYAESEARSKLNKFKAKFNRKNKALREKATEVAESKLTQIS